MNPFRTIQSRLFTTLILAIAVMVILIVMVWRFSLEPALRRGAVLVQREAALRAADEIDDFIERCLAELMAASEVAPLWKGGVGDQREALHRLLKLSPSIQEISLADRSGQDVIRL